jgi:protein-disulfide isomerase
MVQSSSDIFWRVTGAITVVCLVILTFVVVKRDFVEPLGYRLSSLPAQDPERPPPPTVGIPVHEWDALVGQGHRIGPDDATVTFVVFSDFRCPFCARFALETFPELQRRFPGNVALVFRHFPLDRQGMSFSLAVGAECAARYDRFAEFHDVVFDAQRHLEVVSVHELAAAAGISDLEDFGACVDQEGPWEAIDRDVSAVLALGARGTPTIVLNGMWIRGHHVDSITAFIEESL